MAYPPTSSSTSIMMLRPSMDLRYGRRGFGNANGSRRRTGTGAARSEGEVFYQCGRRQRLASYEARPIRSERPRPCLIWGCSNARSFVVRAWVMRRSTARSRSGTASSRYCQPTRKGIRAMDDGGPRPDRTAPRRPGASRRVPAAPAADRASRGRGDPAAHRPLHTPVPGAAMTTDRQLCSRSSRQSSCGSLPVAATTSLISAGRPSASAWRVLSSRRGLATLAAGLSASRIRP